MALLAFWNPLDPYNWNPFGLINFSDFLEFVDTLVFMLCSAAHVISVTYLTLFSIPQYTIWENTGLCYFRQALLIQKLCPHETKTRKGPRFRYTAFNIVSYQVRALSLFAATFLKKNSSYFNCLHMRPSL